MQLKLDDDLLLFHETTRKFLASEASSDQVRAHADHPAGFDGAMWQRAAELGWTSILVPEALGGGRLTSSGLPELAVVAEELGRWVGPGPLVPVSVVAAALARAVPAPRRDRVLRELAAGTATAGWVADHRTIDAPGPTVSVVDGRDVLNGVVSGVEVTGTAAWLIVVVDGHLLLVGTHEPGVRVEPNGGIDLVRRLSTVRFDEVALAAEHRLDTDPELDLDAYLLDVAITLQCAELAGIMARTFEMTLEYVSERVSFGRPISSYQAIKHRMADHRLVLEASHAVVDAAVRALEHPGPSASESASVAKAYLASHATSMLQDFVQLHGGIGVTWEHDLHLYLRRATLASSLYGTVGYHQERLVRLLEQPVENGP
jgi:alkylation response protein AidB-like acyl-CoA dehydrogenase